LSVSQDILYGSQCKIISMLFIA